MPLAIDRRFGWPQAILGCSLCLGMSACSQHPAAAPPPPPAVTVSPPVEREITDYKDFTGRTDAVDSVAVRARVSGYLTRVAFREGSEVKQGDLLFEIDVRPYQAVLDQARGQLQQALANVQLAQANFERAQVLAKKGISAISKQELDTITAQLGTSQAQVTVAKAAVDSATLNVGFCKVRSPIDGRVSRILITVGNLVTQDQTQLTSIVSQDPMYAYFDVDEQTMLQIQELIRQGKMKSARTSNDVPVLMALATDTGFPHKGTVNFVDNRVDPTTGTLQVRGVFANPVVHGSRVLTPGLFVRIRVFMGPPHRALLIPEQAVISDQGQDFVIVVNEQDTVDRRHVVLGQLHGGLRVVEQGLKRGERVIVHGLQRVEAGSKVQPKLAAPEPAGGGTATAISDDRSRSARSGD